MPAKGYRRDGSLEGLLIHGGLLHVAEKIFGASSVRIV